MDFDTLDQTQHDPALRFKVNRIQFFGDGACKFLESVDDQKQLALHNPLLPGLKDLLVNLLKPVLQLLGNPPAFNASRKWRLCRGCQPLFRRYATKAHVGALVIVLPHPFRGELLDVRQVLPVVLR